MNDHTPPAAATLPSAPARLSPAKIVKWTLAAVVLVAAIGFGVHYWRLSRLYVTTDNAYLNANRIEMAAQVSGPVRALWGARPADGEVRRTAVADRSAALPARGRRGGGAARAWSTRQFAESRGGGRGAGAGGAA
jgi:hypothetical protein